MAPYPQAQSPQVSVQTVLAQQGYYRGPIDGVIGPSTSQAIRNYQRDHQLTPTGTINPALAASMGLAGQQVGNVLPAPYYTAYPSYSTWYAAPAYYPRPAPVINIGGWGGNGGYWNRGWGGGYRGYGGGGYRGYGGAYGRGWCR